MKWPRVNIYSSRFQKKFPALANMVIGRNVANVPSVEDFLNHNGYAILECYMNPEQDLVPKVKGILTSSGILAPPIEEMSPLLDIDIIEKSMIQINDLSYKKYTRVSIYCILTLLTISIKCNISKYNFR